MKKTLLLVAMTLMAVGMAFGGTITVTKPDGSNVPMNSICQIAWTATGVTSNVKIRLIRPGGALVKLLENNWSSGSPYNWTVAAPAEVGVTYKIHIKATDNSAEDTSETFTVTAAAGDPGDPGTPGTHGTISDVRLTGASPYPIYEWVTVSWTASGISQEIDMELFRADGLRIGTIYSLPAGTTSHGWLAGNVFTGMVGVGDYKIRISTRDDSSSAESAVFSLVAPTVPPSLYINVPNRYDSIRPGSFHNILWNIRGWLPSPGLVQLTLRREHAPEAEAPVLRIADGVGSSGNSGYFNWYVPPTLAVGRYFVRARVTASLYADSEVFAISASGDPGATEGNNIPVAADLELVGVGVEYYNGNIVAWVKNNGPDRLRSHWVEFHVSFPDSGASRQIAKEMSIRVGHEESVALMELAARSIPSTGLRVVVTIMPFECNIRDSNRHNQHRDVRIFAR
jgi:hypothetical protein